MRSMRSASASSRSPAAVRTKPLGRRSNRRAPNAASRPDRRRLRVEWSIPRRCAATVRRPILAIPLAGVVGSPVSGLILEHFDGSTIMKGWQWLFLLEAVPSLVAGIAVLW
ncbi:hypothetical protein IFDJLNFL_0028 [Methylobacterium dankookense]|uniref:Major facilitator superfamily (MFS) profile domain-containing protein n=1 Tax=Methylobacterium dankookense TaxID=560405 RepID=A0ABQ4R9Z8_9HYPH|nr:hypothetical protein IFDJLNFL_0028 [Methylobacterium dankookense]